MLSHEYETILILRPDVEGATVNALADKFEGVLTDKGGHILDREDWGSRKLAYPIAKHLRGHYVRMNFLAPAETIAELERRIRIEDGIVRFMTVRLADAVDVPTRIEEAAVQRARRLEEEKRRAAEAAAAAEREAELQRELEEKERSNYARSEYQAEGGEKGEAASDDNAAQPAETASE